MSKLNELDKSITELEEQTGILKSNNKILSKVSEIKESLDSSVKKISENNKGFEEIRKNLNSELEKITNQIALLEKANESFINDLTSANKKVIRELEDGLISKLDRLSSEIQNALRSEVNQLEKSVKNDIAERFNQLNDNQKSLFKEQEVNTKLLVEANSKSIKTLNYVLIGLSIGLLIIGLLGLSN
jgi:hypothetical protein